MIGQGYRQYQLCQELLRQEFDAAPERDTVALFDQIRLDQPLIPTSPPIHPKFIGFSFRFQYAFTLASADIQGELLT